MLICAAEQLHFILELNLFDLCFYLLCFQFVSLSGYGMYGGASPYYGNGMYGSTYRGFGSPGSFTQQAEDSTRQAFQSVESIVRAFTSVSYIYCFWKLEEKSSLIPR